MTQQHRITTGLYEARRHSFTWKTSSTVRAKSDLVKRHNHSHMGGLLWIAMLILKLFVIMAPVICQLAEERCQLTRGGFEKVILVVSTVDPVSSTSTQETSCSLLLVREKLKVGACSHLYESPSKRIKLASADEEGGSCYLADGATPCGSKVGSAQVQSGSYCNCFICRPQLCALLQGPPHCQGCPASPPALLPPHTPCPTRRGWLRQSWTAWT